MDVGRKGDRMEAAEIEALQQKALELEQKLVAAEAAKSGDASADELKRLKELNAELIAGRDKAKEAKRAAEQAALEEQGEFKTIAEQLKEEKEKLEKKIEEQSGILGKIKERDEAKLQTLLEAVPENLRETVATNSGTLAEKLELAEKLATVKPQGPGARPSGSVAQETIAEQYKAAVASGDLSAQFALKRQMYEKE